MLRHRAMVLPVVRHLHQPALPAAKRTRRAPIEVFVQRIKISRRARWDLFISTGRSRALGFSAVARPPARVLGGTCSAEGPHVRGASPRGLRRKRRAFWRAGLLRRNPARRAIGSAFAAKV